MDQEQHLAASLQELVDSDFRALLESATRRLGPERCSGALKAWEPYVKPYDGLDGWRACGLARAYGGIGEMECDAENVGATCWNFAKKAFGLTSSEVSAVVDAFDAPGTPKHRLLKDLLAKEASRIDCVRPVVA